MIAGDLVFCHSTGIMGKAIRLGEWIRFRKGSAWNHVAVLDRQVDEKWYVIQAEAHGVTNDKTLDSIAPGGRYQVVSPPAGCDRTRLLSFAQSQVGSKYGWLSILSLVFDLLTPDWFPAVRRKNTWICSALSMECCRAAGWIHSWNDIYIVTPAQAWLAVASN